MRRGNEGRGWEQQWRTRFTSTPGRSIGRASSGLLERAEGSGIRPFPRAQASFRKEVVCQGWKGFLEYLKFLNSLSCCTGALLAGSEKNAISDAKSMTILHMRKSCNYGVAVRFFISSFFEFQEELVKGEFINSKLIIRLLPKQRRPIILSSKNF